MNLKDKILNKMFAQAPGTLNVAKEARQYIHLAMDEYYNVMSIADKRMKKRRLISIVWGYIGKQTWEEFVSMVRAKRLQRIKKMVQRLSNEDNRKYYIIRASETGYKYFSSKDVKFNKKLRVFKSDVDVVKLHEAADAVIRPKRG
jgi:hypothetical protein